MDFERSNDAGQTLMAAKHSSHAYQRREMQVQWRSRDVKGEREGSVEDVSCRPNVGLGWCCSFSNLLRATVPA